MFRFALAFAAMTTPALAEVGSVVCPLQPLSDIVQYLDQMHGQREVARSLDRTGAVIIIFVGRDRDYTIVAVNADQSACMITSGSHFYIVEPNA